MSIVSVIMPAYNAARYIGEAIGSLLNQSFTDWELILVNDGSSDETLAIAQSYSDPRIQITSQANQGEAGARNTALNLATGKYISFLDADDLYLPNALTDMVDYMMQHPHVDALFSDGYFCDEAGQTLMKLSEHRPGPYEGNILEFVVLSGSVITVPVCTMVCRNTVEKEKVRFDPALVIGPDWDFWIQLARYARFGYLDSLTCIYRVHQTNITRTSGQTRRSADLVRGRYKVMNANWFADLSTSTRAAFFTDFITNLLKNNPQEQQMVLQSVEFMALPVNIQSRILRQTATSYLLQRQEIDFARHCLQKSIQIQPNDRKSQTVLKLLSFNPQLCVSVVSCWRSLSMAKQKMKSLAQPTRKPVPQMLRPID